MKTRSIYVYSDQKLFSVILVLVVTLTVVILGQLYRSSLRKRNVLNYNIWNVKNNLQFLEKLTIFQTISVNFDEIQSIAH